MKDDKGMKFDEIDPIRETVRWLRDHGFHTVDRGDCSKTQEMERDVFPMVAIKVDPTRSLILEADRLRGLLAVECVALKDGDIQATYDPVSGLALIVLSNVTISLVRTSCIDNDDGMVDRARAFARLILASTATEVMELLSPGVSLVEKLADIRYHKSYMSDTITALQERHAKATPDFQNEQKT